MNFKKLALAAAIASLPAVGFSVESLDDTDLGTVTGQDGIEVSIAIGASGITADIYLHDTDGLDAGYASYSYDGAIVIEGMAIAVGGATITLEIDAGDNQASAGAPILNINVGLPSALTITTGDISVANSEIDDTPAGRGINTQSSTLLSSMTIVLGSTSLNIQLGNEEQTGSISGSDMIVLSATITGGLTISNFALNDTSVGGGAIGMSSMTITDAAGGSDLTVAADINVTTSGLVVGLGTLGTGGMAIEIVDQYLGLSADVIGDVSIRNLNLNGTTITISGK